MILYLSSATAYPVYDDLFKKGLIDSGYQVQKFNHTLISGLSNFEKVVSVAALQYKNVKASPIRFVQDNAEFYVVGNSRGLIRKFKRIFSVKSFAERIIKREKPEFIVCDAILPPASLAAIKLGKKYKIPTVAIVTDIPEAFVNGGMRGISKKIVAKYMKKYDYYVLLTKDMDAVVNPFGKPSIVMEGVCDISPQTESLSFAKRAIVYTGSLWKNAAGLECFTDGFINANLPDTELLFYGTGEFQSVLKEKYKDFPNVKYMGVKTNAEILKAQKGATLLINPRPSVDEFTKFSFPSKTIEYMSSGTPVLTTKLKGIPDEYFEYVYTLEDETATGVENALKKIFSIPEVERQTFGERAKSFIETNKNKTVQVKKILDFLRSN